MDNLKILIEVNPKDRESVQTIIDFLQTGISGKQSEAAPAEPAKKEPAKKAPAKKVPAKKAPAKKEEKPENDSDVTDDEIRSLITSVLKKNDENRPKLRAKFEELDAKGIGDLDPSNYQAMFDFLTDLENED